MAVGIVVFLFLSTPSARRATGPRMGSRSVCGISIHALREEGDVLHVLDALPVSDFYPRPPRGGRPYFLVIFKPGKEFLSTPSARRATGRHGSRAPLKPEFLSTPSARRATCPLQPFNMQSPISIHALREEGDADRHGDGRRAADFYPRPPRGGRLMAPDGVLSAAEISIHALREEGDQ